MKASLKEYAELKEQVEDLKTNLLRTEGQLIQAKEVLKNQFGCLSLKQAKKKLQEMKDRKEGLEILFEESLITFKKQLSAMQ